LVFRQYKAPISCLYEFYHTGKEINAHWGLLLKIVPCGVNVHNFYMGWRQIAVAPLSVTTVGAAVTFAIDLVRHAFALWHWACASSGQTFQMLGMGIVFLSAPACPLGGDDVVEITATKAARTKSCVAERCGGSIRSAWRRRGDGSGGAPPPTLAFHGGGNKRHLSSLAMGRRRTNKLSLTLNSGFLARAFDERSALSLVRRTALRARCRDGAVDA
jgi:hypothetical protein